MEQEKKKSPDTENGESIRAYTAKSLYEKSRKELEKQMELLSKLSEKEDLTIQEHLGIAAEIRQIIMLF